MRFHDRSHLNLQPIACRDAPEFMSSVCEKGNKDWGTCGWLVYPLFVCSVSSIADVSIHRSGDMVFSPKGHTQKTSCCFQAMQPKDNARIWSKMIKIKICLNNPVYNRNTTEMLQISVRKSKTWCCHAAMACVCRPMYRSRRVTSIVTTLSSRNKIAAFDTKKGHSKVVVGQRHLLSPPLRCPLRDTSPPPPSEPAAASWVDEITQRMQQGTVNASIVLHARERWAVLRTKPVRSRRSCQKYPQSNKLSFAPVGFLRFARNAGRFPLFESIRTL